MKDILRLPFLFWTEMLFGFLGLLALWVFLDQKIGKGAWLAFVVLGAAATLALIGRLVRKAIALRNQKGPMRGNGLVAFWVGLLLPAALVALLGPLARDNQARLAIEARQEEARKVLLALHEAEVGFKRDYGRYTFKMNELSLGLADGERVYAVGFPTACSIKEGGTLDKSRVLANEYPPSEMRRVEIEEFFQKARNAEDCKDQKEGFEAYALGVPREGGQLDVWRIDDGGKLENVRRAP